MGWRPLAATVMLVAIALVAIAITLPGDRGDAPAAPSGRPGNIDRSPAVAEPPAPPAGLPVPSAGPPETAVTGTGLLSGRVLGGDLRPIAGARVVAVAGGASVAAVTDGEGGYRLEELPLRTPVEVRVEGPGFSPLKEGPVSIDASQGRWNWVIPGGEGTTSENRALCLTGLGTREADGRVVVWVRGVARFPDGTLLTLDLAHEEQIIHRGECLVEGGRFRGEIHPDEEGLFSGGYTVRVQYNPWIQRELPPVDGKDLPETVEAAARVYLGSREEEARELADEQEFFRRKVALFRRLYTELRTQSKRVLEAAGPASSRNGGPGEGSRTRTCTAQAARVGALVLSTVKRALVIQLWRQWLDSSYRPWILDEADLIGRRPILRYPRAKEVLVRTFHLLELLSRHESHVVYDGLGVPRDPMDDLSSFFPVGRPQLFQWINRNLRSLHESGVLGSPEEEGFRD